MNKTTNQEFSTLMSSFSKKNKYFSMKSFLEVRSIPILPFPLLFSSSGRLRKVWHPLKLVDPPSLPYFNNLVHIIRDYDFPGGFVSSTCYTGLDWCGSEQRFDFTFHISLWRRLEVQEVWCIIPWEVRGSRSSSCFRACRRHLEYDRFSVPRVFCFEIVVMFCWFQLKYQRV